MFRTGSPYSPFFTSGFLSETVSLRPPPGPRRGSLPTDSPPILSPSTDESSAFYFTLQPQRDMSEYRSFLSLDLAESQSLRSASLKRKISSTSACSRLGNTPLSVFASIPEAPARLGLPQSPLRVRMSRDSLRTIPSPKPAPSITLPDVPKQSSPSSSSSPVSPTPPRLPSFAFSTSLGLSLERASQSAPTLVISRTPTPPVVHKLPKRLSIASSSSASTGVRRVNRSDALACLEGRSKPSNLPTPLYLSTRQKQNFMSMSDDEDDADAESFDLPVDEPEDIVLPASLRTPSPVKSPPVSGRFPSLTSFRSSSSRGFKHQPDWFPLKSFIDLRNDEDVSAWTWRSWIEVASVS